MTSRRPLVFLLSPAFCGGRRAGIALKPDSVLPIAQQLRAGTLELGAAFAFFSGLYFRGKLAYSLKFGSAAGEDLEPALVITPTRGLMAPHERVNPELIREFATVDVALDDLRYRGPLERDVKLLARSLPKMRKWCCSVAWLQESMWICYCRCSVAGSAIQRRSSAEAT